MYYEFRLGPLQTRISVASIFTGRIKRRGQRNTRLELEIPIACASSTLVMIFINAQHLYAFLMGEYLPKARFISPSAVITEFL